MHMRQVEAADSILLVTSDWSRSQVLALVRGSRRVLQRARVVQKPQVRFYAAHKQAVEVVSFTSWVAASVSTCRQSAVSESAFACEGYASLE